MAKLDYEKLLGGYATGTLTDEEREALFQAALHDQVLFNALADDQALKELLDDPASRQRLLTALESLEETQEKSSRWGALVPAWLPLPATSQSGRTAERLYATTPRLPPPKSRSWRGALAGGVILAALAVIVAAGLIEEMTSPPQPVLTTDARRTEEPAPPASAPAPRVPVEPVPQASAPVPVPAPSSPAPRENLAGLDRSREDTKEQPTRKAIPTRPPREVERESLVSDVERRRARETPVTASPADSFSQPSEQRALMKAEAPPDFPGRSQDVGLGGTTLRDQPVVLSARALFYGGAGSLDLGGEGLGRGGTSEENKSGPSQFAMARKKAPDEGAGLGGLQTNLARQAQSTRRPLGMRYSLVKRTPDGEDLEVSSKAVFNVGDEMRLTVEVNVAGYLYVLRRTPPEVWTVLYPSLGTMADPAGRAAYVHSGTRYIIPSRGSMVEAGASGPTQFVLLFTREPQTELGSLGIATDRDAVRNATISDLVRRIRTEVAGGKLLIEQVDSFQPDTPSERAVYVVDHGAPLVPRLLVDVTLSFR